MTIIFERALKKHCTTVMIRYSYTFHDDCNEHKDDKDCDHVEDQLMPANASLFPFARSFFLHLDGIAEIAKQIV